MAKDNLSKYVKKSATRTRGIAQKSGSWMSNAMKSVGYSTFDVLSELMPSTIDVAKVTASTGKDIADSIKQSRTGDKSLRNAIDRNYYVGLGREVFKNSLEDLKSGKFYNKERVDKYFSDMNDDMMDMGDGYDFEDFDMGEDDFSSSVESSDGSANASFKRKKGGNNEATSIVVNTNLGEDSALYQATNYQTETMVNVSRAVVDYSITNTRATLSMLGNIRNEMGASLTSINDNVSTIATTVNDSLSKHTALSAKYYEDSISLQTQILEALKVQAPDTTVNTRKFRDYNDVMDMFSIGGGLDAKAYKNLVNKQLNNYIDSNMILSQLKFVASEKDTLKMMAQNPLAFIPKAITKQLIPNTVKSIVEEFDNQLKETAIAGLNQISGLQRSDNALLSAIGKIFGVQNKITISSVDKGAYNKGATAWTGTDHQALTNVIPTFLRKIYSAVSGTEEVVFDYEKGTYSKLRDVEKRNQQDKRSRETSLYGDYKSEFREFLDQTVAADRKTKDQYSEDFETFLAALTRDSAGGRTFRKNGRNGKEVGRDDIRELMGKSSSNDASVQLVRAYLEGMEGVNNSKLTALFGRLPQEQRALLDRTMREMQADPVKYNTMYMNTGLGEHNKEGHGKRYGLATDSHLTYTKDGTKITGTVGGLVGAGIDKFGHDQNYYLREILKTLNTGIYVVPINKTLTGTLTSESPEFTEISKRMGSVSDSFKSDVDKYNASKPQENTTTYTEERREKDDKAGKIDMSQEVNLDQLKAHSVDYHRTNAASKDDKPNFIMKLLNMLPEDSGAGKLVNHLNNGINGGKTAVSGFFKKADTLLFNIVFGNPKGHRGITALFDTGINALKAGFVKFSSFIDAKILTPLEETLFGEDGIFNKVKQTELWTKVSTMFKDLTSKAGTFFLGEKDAEGNRSGGLFSETANSLKDMGNNVKTAILGEKGPDGKPLPLEQDNSVVGNIKRMFNNVVTSVESSMGLDTSKPRESLGTRLATGMDAIYDRLSERANEFSTNVFGEEGTTGRQYLDQFKEDMKGQKGYIGASAVVGSVGTMLFSSHMGLLGSLFLPSGPVGGAILGAGVGIISKSTGLKNFLFGPEEEGEDGKTYRAGGLITKEVQDFFKENKTGIKVGGFAGLAASYGLLPSFFVPGGPIGGALIGGAVSLATKSNEFQKFLYGEGGTKDDPTGGITKKLKEIFGKDKTTKSLAIDAGIGAGVGLVGSFFLPGGPILNALLGSAASVGLASDKFQNWFFGEKNEKGKREGGVFTKFTDFTKEKIFSPLAKSVKIAQNHILGFVKKEMVIPFKYAIDPLVTEAKHLGGVIKSKVSDVFNSVKEEFKTHVTKPIGEAVDKYFLQPLKNTLSKFFSGLGKLIGNIIAAPFRILSGAGDSAYESQKKRGVSGYKQGVVDKYKADRDQLLTDENGNRLGFFARAGKIPQRLGLWGKMVRDKNNKENQKAAQFSDQGAYYERGQKVERYDRRDQERAAVDAEVAAKDYAIRNGTTVNTSSVARPISPKTSGGTTQTSPNTTKVSGSSGDTKVSGISMGEFSRRTGLSRGVIRNKIKSGEIQATKIANTWSIPESYVDKYKSSTTTVSTDTGSSSESGEVDTSVPTVSDSESGSKVASTSTTQPGNTSVSTVPSTTSSKDKGSKASKSSVGKPDSSFYTTVKKDVGQIATSVYGQLNGVGSNINKIYKLLLKKFNVKDEDIKGENNKEYVGFFGKIRTALNRPIEAITSLITAPFRKLSELGHAFVGKIKGLGTSLVNAGKGLIGGIKGIASGIGSVLKELLMVPIDILHTGLKAVRAALPAIGEALKAGVQVIGSGLKVAGSLLVTGVKSVGETIKGAASGLGNMLGGAMSGLGSLLSSVGLISGEALKGIWKGVKKVGGTVLNVASNVVSAPFKLIGGIASGIGKGAGGLFGKKVQHVIVDSGTLDTVKTVKRVKKVETGGKGGDDEAKPIRPIKVSSAPSLLGGFGDKKKNPIHVVVENFTKSATNGFIKALKDKLFGDKNPFKKLGGKPGAKIDTNVGDTSVSTNQTAGGPADGDVDKTDNVGETALVNSVDEFKESVSNAKDKFSDALSAIKGNYDEKISKRQAQVDKGSRTALLSRFEAEKKDKEDAEFKSKMINYLGTTAKSTEEHKSLFSGIFGKKGLITAGILLLLPIFVKLFKKLNLGEYIKDFFQGVAEQGGVSGIINNIGEKAKQVESVVTGKESNYEVDEDGNLVYDEDGSLKKKEEDVSPVTALLTPTKTRVDTETGKWENTNNWTGTSGATAKVVTKGAETAVKKGTKLLKSEGGQAVVNGVKTATAGVKKWLKSGKALNNLEKAGKTEYVAKASTSVKAASKVTGAADKLVSGVKTTAEKVAKSDIVQTFIEKGKSALEFLISKLAAVGEKFGVTIPTSSYDDIMKTLTEKFFKSDVLAAYKEKISQFMGKLSGRTVAIAMDVGFVLYGVVNGAANAGYLFEVNSDAVDTKMRLISAVFQGLMGTTMGSIIDFVNSMIYDILGTNFIKIVASMTYNLISNDEDSAALEAAQKDFTSEYEDYVEKEYEAYKQGAEEQGQEAMSLDEFKASDLSTTRSEYNSNTNKSILKRGIDTIKGVGKGVKNVGKTIGGVASGAVTGIKNAGSTALSGIKAAGSWIGDKASAAGNWIGEKASNIGSAVSSGLSTAKDTIGSGVTTVVNKGKEIFGNVGSAIGNVASYGAEAAKGIASGYQNIVAAFNNKDNDFMDYFKSDVNVVSEDNPFHGIVGGILNVAKFTMFPKLVVFGILKKVGTAIANGVTTVFNGAKNALSDYNSNVSNLNKIALAGDLSGLGSYEVTTSEDNPIGGFVSGMVGISRVLHYPIALVALGAKKVVDGVKSVFTGAKNALSDYNSNVTTLNKLSLAGDLEGLGNYEVTISEDNPVGGFVSGMVGISRVLHYPVALLSLGARKVVDSIKNVYTGAKNAMGDYSTNVSTLNQLSLAGDLEGLGNYEVTISEDNPVGGFVSGMVGISRVLHYPVALVVAGGKKIVGGVKGAVTAVATTGSQVKTGFTDLASLAISGDVSGLKEYSGVDEEGNPIGGIANGILGVGKIVLSPVAIVTSAGRSLKELILGKINDVKDFGTKLSTFVTKLTAYTDPDKDISGWKSETLASDDSDIVGGILGGLVKKIMWVYVGLVRGVKSAFGFLGDAADAVGTTVSNATSAASDAISDAASSIGNAVNSIGTSIMNLGRGGNDGGRPIAGKGGSGDYLNGMPYYSQNDPKYKNKQYKQTGGFGDGDTIGESGCGPTAMAMVASKYAGNGYNPTTMAKMAEDGGYSTSVGTTPGYFSAAGNALGIPNQQVAPTKDSLQTSLANGNSVILQGAKGGVTNSPYTSEGHYVTATGVDGDNVIINDPRGKQYSGEYKMSDVIHDTTGMWSFGGQGGFGSGAKDKWYSRNIGGKGSSTSTTAGVTAADVVKVAQNEIGYMEKKSNGSLDSKTANVGDNNYTKYAPAVGQSNGAPWCATFVCYCFYIAANKDKTKAKSVLCNAFTASCSSNESAFKSAGRWLSGSARPQVGDIIFYTHSHTGIVVEVSGNTFYTIEGNTSGDNSTERNGGMVAKKSRTVGGSKIKGFGRPKYDGASAFNGDLSSYSDSDTSSDSSSSSDDSSSATSLSELLSGMADAVTNPIYEKLGLNVSGDTTTTSTSTDSDSTTSTIDAASVTGSSNAQKIWNYFTKNGYSKAAAAAILGNAQQESGIDPATGKSESAAAHGIFQWESGRFTKLKNYAKKMGTNWYTIEPQIGYLSTELPDPDVAYFNKKATYGANVGHGAAGKTNFEVAGTSPTTFESWKKSTNVDTATRQFEAAVERASWPRIDKRVAYAKGFYNKYSGGSGGDDGGRPIKRISQTDQALNEKQNALYGGKGNVSTTSQSLSNITSQSTTSTSSNVSTGKSDDVSQMFKLMVEYLSQIVDNTGEANIELENLNNKDFGSTVSQTNTTNNLIDSSSKTTDSSNQKSTADRSEYAMAKKVARGVLS
jgi:hypothetical protein